MDNLPEELLIKIFNFLPPTILIACTLVCSKFNKIISSSPKLLQNVTVNLNTIKKYDDWCGNRKYSKIIVRDFKAYCGRIKLLASYLRYLSVIDNEIDVDELKIILESAENLREFHLTVKNNKNSDIEDGSEDLSENYGESSRNCTNKYEFEAEIDSNSDTDSEIMNNNTNNCKNQPKHLDVFTLHGFSSLLSHFSHFQVKNFKISLHHNEPTANTDEIKKFLSKQQNLKSLDIHSIREGLFNDDSLLNVNFRLTELKFYEIKSQEIENFIEFIKIHEDSLSHVLIYSFQIEIFKILEKFKNLKTLTSFSNQFSDIHMENIENLSLRGVSGDEDWTGKFPNVRNLELIWCDGYEGLKKLTKLECLIVKSDKVPLSLPNVKIFKFINGLYK